MADNDSKAFSELYDRYSNLSYRLCLEIVSGKEEAQDVVQEVFLQVWKSASKYDIKRGAVSTWIINITRSRAIDHLRKNRFKNSTIPFIENMPLSTTKKDIEIELEHKKLLFTSLETLPKEQKAAIENVYFNGLTHDEISVKFNIPLGTVKTRIRLAIPKLREYLFPYFAFDENH